MVCEAWFGLVALVFIGLHGCTSLHWFVLVVMVALVALVAFVCMGWAWDRAQARTGCPGTQPGLALFGPGPGPGPHLFAFNSIGLEGSTRNIQIKSSWFRRA